MEKILYKNYRNKNLAFKLVRYYPRQNEYEKGLKYRLCVAYGEYNKNDPLTDYFGTGYCFSTIKEVKAWIKENYFIFL